MTSLGNKETFSKNLKKYMSKFNKDRNDMVEELGFKYTTFNDWYNGHTYPRIDSIEKMANYFGITKADLIEDHYDAQPTIKFPYRFTDALEARKYLSMHTFHGSEGFSNADIDKMGDEEVLEFANDVLKLMDTLSYKYRK